jgi:hypothetical protein
MYNSCYAKKNMQNIFNSIFSNLPLEYSISRTAVQYLSIYYSKESGSQDMLAISLFFHPSVCKNRLVGFQDNVPREANHNNRNHTRLSMLIRKYIANNCHIMLASKLFSNFAKPIRPPFIRQFNLLRRVERLGSMKL